MPLIVHISEFISIPELHIMAKWTAERRRNLPLSSFADPENRKYPIVDQDDVDSAAHLVGRAANPDAVRKRIISIAKRLGLSIPDAWKEDADKSAAEIERKTIDFAIKDVGDGEGSGSFTLYAAIFGNIDKSNEKILPNAFKNLPEFVQDGFFALNHDWKSLPIGLISEASQDSVGLKVSGYFHSHTEAQSARRVMIERMAHGKSIKCSIGYVVNDDARAVENGKAFRVLKSITVYEASMVSVPANELAHVVSVKAMAEGDDESGGAGVPADDHPMVVRKGQMTKWGAYAKGIVPGRGVVQSIHTKGMVPDVSNEAEATAADPHARIHVHAKDADGDLMPTADFQAHPVKHLVKCMGTMDGIAALKPETKGEYLGNTDEMMASAAYSRLHDTLGYYVVSQINTDQSPDDVKAAVGGAIDEFKDTTLSMLGGLLLEDDPEDEDDDAADAGPTTEAPAVAPPAYGAMGHRALAAKFLHCLSGFDTSRDRAVSALALEDRSKSVVSAAEGLAQIGRHFADVRLKEGRMLSASTVNRLKAAADSMRPALAAIEALIDDAAPKTTGEGKAKAHDADADPPPPPTQGDAAMSAGDRAATRADPADILRARADLARYELATSGV